MNKKTEEEFNKQELFENTSISKALRILAGPAVVSQLISIVYNIADTFFIGRTGNSYMIAATTLSLTIMLMTISISNLFGIGGGSLMSRLSGMKKCDTARQASAYSFYGAIAGSLIYSFIIGVFIAPILELFGASQATFGYARTYTLIVVVIGGLPSILSAVMAHLLRNAGYSEKASMGLSGGGLMNILLDPLFMFVLLPEGNEVTGAALATLVSNTAACIYLLHAYRQASDSTMLSMKFVDSRMLSKRYKKELYYVGVPSAVLTGLFDVANIFLNAFAAAHGDFVLAGLGIVMKIERIPNAISIGICQGMIPLVAYNYTSGNHNRMREVMLMARKWGIGISLVSIIILEIFARPACGIFINTTARNMTASMSTIAYAVALLRIRCLASPFQFLNYSSSFSMQAMGDGRDTLIHAITREFVFYVPMMFVFDRLWSVMGLSIALPVGEACAAVVALWLVKRFLRRS